MNSITIHAVVLRFRLEAEGRFPLLYFVFPSPFLLPYGHWVSVVNSFDQVGGVMNFRRKAATVISALAVMGGGMLVTAGPAQADGPCSSGALCVYDQDNFKGDRILTRSTNTCFNVGDTSSAFAEINSYDSNLSVNGYVWDYIGNGYYELRRTLVAGGFSSNVGFDGLGSPADWICLGGADLNDFI
ncbi:peptidase inhibitor family I36 protein [Streptomyces sp. NPDC000134]|uniref:peptidase inhibitor family I36 protein n=1 Tax=Streptomyces sp. NPDC000134 TaxID=3364536 RepID=UPI0036911F72